MVSEKQSSIKSEFQASIVHEIASGKMSLVWELKLSTLNHSKLEREISSLT